MANPLPPCNVCGGAMQRVTSMPGHVVCGSGHLYLEEEALPPAPPGSQITRVGKSSSGQGA
ncbi:MAG: hypothetical protein AAF533_13235 [Acidobacteriota bacterium]